MRIEDDFEDLLASVDIGGFFVVFPERFHASSFTIGLFDFFQGQLPLVAGHYTP